MPFSPAQPDYRPLYQGMASFGQSLGDAMEKAVERKQALADKAKEEKKVRDAAEIILEKSFGHDRNALAKLSAGDVHGLLQSATLDRTERQRLADDAMRLYQIRSGEKRDERDFNQRNLERLDRLDAQKAALDQQMRSSMDANARFYAGLNQEADIANARMTERPWHPSTDYMTGEPIATRVGADGNLEVARQPKTTKQVEAQPLPSSLADYKVGQPYINDNGLIGVWNGQMLVPVAAGQSIKPVSAAPSAKQPKDLFSKATPAVRAEAELEDAKNRKKAAEVVQARIAEQEAIIDEADKNPLVSDSAGGGFGYYMPMPRKVPKYSSAINRAAVQTKAKEEIERLKKRLAELQP